MSQRLYIGTPETRSHWDCIIESPEGVATKLRADWLCVGDPFLDPDGKIRRFFAGPWKIRIADKALFREVEPEIKALFDEFGKEYPDCIWGFYFGDDWIEHPTAEQLEEWLNDPQRIQRAK